MGLKMIQTNMGDSTYYENEKNDELYGLTVFTKEYIAEDRQLNPGNSIYDIMLEHEQRMAIQVITGQMDIVFIDANTNELSMCLQVAPGDKLGVMTLNEKGNLDECAMDSLLTRSGTIFMYVEPIGAKKVYFMLNFNSKNMGTLTMHSALGDVASERFDYSTLDSDIQEFVHKIFPDGRTTMLVITERP